MTADRMQPIPPVFTPGNEPYLGRASVYNFDQVILSCISVNDAAAAYSRASIKSLSRLQIAACQIIPQGTNIALSIRELVRQGYLFGAVVLMRPLIERTAIFSYLHETPGALETWEGGWKHRERPSLTTMLQTMHGNADVDTAKEICGLFNHLVHGDPFSASFNQLPLGVDGLGYASGKILNNPELCDFICFQSYCYLIVLMARATAIFPAANHEQKTPA